MWSNTIISPWGEPFKDMQEDLDKLRTDKRRASLHAEHSQPMDLVATGYPSSQKLARFDHHWMCVQTAKCRQLLWQIIKFTQRTGFWMAANLHRVNKHVLWESIWTGTSQKSHQSLCDGGVHLGFPFPITYSQCCCLLHVPSLRWSLHHCLSVACHWNPGAPRPL